MLQLQQTHGWGDGTRDLGMAHAQQERYRTALGVIHHTTSVVGQCACCLVVAQVAREALTPPATTMDYWRHCEA